MRVFVTGGTGFVGKPTVGRLIEDGHQVRCLARRASSTGELQRLGCETAYGDVTDKASVLEGMRGCEWVVNLANLYSFWEPDKDLYRRVNVEGTRNVMEAALEASVAKVVHVSSFVVWGKDRHMAEERFLNRFEPYPPRVPQPQLVGAEEPPEKPRRKRTRSFPST